ncbi:ankyrin repeat-containing domain protein [Xylaria arbuscula]|nr:ankyrin repeat-containing domain protein [Xylaria arbuscula]
MPASVEMQQTVRDLDIDNSTVTIISNFNGDNETPADTDVLEWLSPTPCTDRHSDVATRRIEGIGAWLLEDEQYLRWLHRQDASSVLWCQGQPGAGKTFLMSFVVDKLRRMQSVKVGVAYAYLDYAESGTQTVEKITSELIKQLSRDNTGDVVNLFRECGKRKSRPNSWQLKNTLTDICGRFERVFFILDAVDEFHNEKRRYMLESLHLPNCQLFLTSRPHLDLQHIFRGCLKIELDQVTLKDKRNDMELLISEKITRDASLSALIKDNETFGNKVVSGIMQQANGMLLLASLQLDIISRSTTRASILEKLGRLPTTLGDSYDRTLERVEGQDFERRNLAYHVFQWLTYAKRIMTIMELKHAISVKEGDSNINEDAMPPVEIITQVCMGLVIVDRDTRSVRLIHYSVQEHLEKCFGRPAVGSFTVRKDMIVNKCLTVLLFEEPDEDHEQLYPMLSYAADYWTYHAGNNSTDTTKSLALQFLRDETKVKRSVEALRDHPRLRQEIVTGLHVSSFFGQEGCVRSLLVSTMELDLGGSLGRTPLAMAAENGYDTIVELLMGAGADVDGGCGDFQLERESQRPLISAVHNGHDRVVNQLFDAGAKSSPITLSVASGNGYEKLVERLLDAGASDYDDSLSAALCNGHERVVNCLLEAILQSSTPRECKCALEMASKRGHERAVKQLLFAGTNPKNSIALAQASANGHENVVRLLVNAGTDVGMDLAVQAAANAGHDKVIEILLREGANVNSAQQMCAEKFGFLCLFRHLHRRIYPLEPTVNIFDATKPPLELAAKAGHENVVSLLLKAGAEVNVTNALHAAITAGHENVVKLLIEVGQADVNYRGKGDAAHSPIQLATIAGQERMVALLLEKGANVNSRSENPSACHINALCAAIETGHVEIAEKLLEKGATPHHGALYLASERGHETVVQRLISLGADPNERESPDERKWPEWSDEREWQEWPDRSPLQVALLNGHKEVVRQLIQAGANFNAHCRSYGSIVEAASAVLNQHWRVAEQLLNSGAVVSWQGGRSFDALMKASKACQIKVVLGLLKAGIHVSASKFGFILQNVMDDRDTRNHPDLQNMVGALLQEALTYNDMADEIYGDVLVKGSSHGWTGVVRLLLFDAREVLAAQIKGCERGLNEAIKCGQLKVIEQFLEAGAVVHPQSKDCETALHMASKKGYKTIVEGLLKAGVNTKGECEFYGSVLQAAAGERHGSIVRLLLNAGADPNAQGGKYGNALQAASGAGHEGVVRLLLQAGTSVNSKGGFYGNALQAASYKGHKNVVAILIENGADVHAPGGRHGSPLEAAVKGGHIEVVELLQERLKSKRTSLDSVIFYTSLVALGCVVLGLTAHFLMRRGTFTSLGWSVSRR